MSTNSDNHKRVLISTGLNMKLRGTLPSCLLACLLCSIQIINGSIDNARKIAGLIILTTSPAVKMTNPTIVGKLKLCLLKVKASF
ncbi:hypothetical protein HYN51_04775 [Limnobaculum parvum]|uniref:Uncharacterized protein n=1 Tax=Limnobaculum parvum TaxID=2172103 RepID=A0A2Y9TWP9_9GAMM|nr:hypothetical protein HYN51_04775 [Limnobaculum parvum]